MSDQPKIYRFKFSESFLEKLIEFSQIHRYEHPKIFKENWDTWILDNKDLIESETKFLRKKNYQGDVIEKMYKSTRYYFKNKSNKKEEPKKRRLYSRLQSELLIWMDTHIARNYNKKPKDAFIAFMDYEQTKEFINNEKTTLNKEAFKTKIKKTYKNRFYNFNKNN